MKLLSKILKIRTLFARNPATAGVNMLYEHLDREASSLKEKTSAPMFAVQGVEDTLYYGILSMISIDVRQRIEAKGRMVVTRSFNAWVGKGLIAFLMRSRFVGLLISSQWLRINRRVVGELYDQ